MHARILLVVALCGCAVTPTEDPWSAPDVSEVLGEESSPPLVSPPPAPDTLRIEVDPLTLDFPARIKAWGASEGQTVHFVRGAAVGLGACFPALGGACLGVTNAAILGSAVADERGLAVLEVRIPGTVGLRDVALQAVLPDGTDSLLSTAATYPTVECLGVPADHATIQDAIDAAVDGDAVCVSAGTWSVALELDHKSIALLGEGETTTVLEGTGSGDRILWVNASSAQVSRFRLTDNERHQGAGIEVTSADPLLSDLHFDGLTCRSDTCYGVGLSVSASASTLRDLTFTGIDADTTGGVGANRDVLGAALYVYNLVPTDLVTLERVDVQGTQAVAANTVDGGAVRVWGGDGAVVSHLTVSDTSSEGLDIRGAVSTENAIALDHVQVLDNDAMAGGPLSLDFDCSPGLHVDGNAYDGGLVEITNTVVAGNHCADGVALGLGVHLTGMTYEGVYELTNVDIVGNTAGAAATTAEAGGLYLHQTNEVTLTNVTISDHGTTGDGSAIHAADYAINGQPSNVIVDVSFSDLWDNSAPQVYGIPDPIGLDGNVEVDPEYVDRTAPAAVDWDLRLLPGSPLVDAGDPALLDPDGTISDVGAYGGPEGG